MSNSYLDPIQFDGTPKAHPAWFRGRDIGIKEMLNIVDAIITGADDGSGVCNAQPIEIMRRTLLEWRERVTAPPAKVKEIEIPEQPAPDVKKEEAKKEKEEKKK